MEAHQFRELVNDLRDIAKQFHAHDSLRDRISGRLREAEKAADRMREALQAISTMADQTYYKVNPKETAADAHLIAVGALANSTEAARSPSGWRFP